MTQATSEKRTVSYRRGSFARSIESRVRQFIHRREVLLPNETIVLAVSGGRDSTALLFVLHRLASDFGWRLSVAHFDHRLRGQEEAAADRVFVAGLARSLGLPFAEDAGDVARRAKARGESMEQAARVLRYRFLARKARTASAAVVATGHTRDDQAETVLLHLIRGSGLEGLAGMRPRSPWPLGKGPQIARPLLVLQRSETLAYCHELGIEPREDATNELLLATRNRVRLKVLPAMRELNPKVEEALVRLAEVAHEDSAALEEEAREALAGASRALRGSVILDLGAVRALRPALQARVLRLAVARLLGSEADIEAVHVEALMRLVESPPGQASIARGVTAVRDSQTLTLVKGTPLVSVAMPEVRLAIPGVTEAGGWRFEAERVTYRRRTRARPYEVYLDEAVLSGGLWVRSRRSGDRMRPMGLGGTKKLQDIMVDAKIPRSERDAVPVVAAEWGIVWVVGVCLDERAAVGQATGSTVRIRAVRIR